jgi:2-oxoglutarate/2-oxoacid ferredoxin oxidoreductase subunit alpha
VDYVYNMERLLRKFKTAASLVPQPVLRLAAQESRWGVIYFGSTSPAMREALDVLQDEGGQKSWACFWCETRCHGRLTWPSA